tara:strand:- start:1014 stop:1826 length:813 start_codon:yes stop_codon:yes gene_type:complete
MLTIYAPFNNPKSKAWEVFNGVKKSWPDQHQLKDNSQETDPVANSMYWGFVNNNLQLVKKLEARKHEFWFTDTPYFGRFDNNNLLPNNHYWRICKNRIHVPYIRGCKADRFEKFGLKIKAPDFKGSYILICPSSNGIHQYLDRPNWTKETIEQIKRYTDRPIKIRDKPRGRGTSGPSEATVPLSEDLKDAWCLVTSCSIAAVEAQCMGIPVICDEKSFAKEIGSQQLADIEDPYFVGCEDWLYSLAYQQFTPEEIENGKAVEILIDKGIL